MTQIRQAAVAGSFYPANAKKLERDIHAMVEAAGTGQGPAPKALIVPHAGYAYSGPVAAGAYARLMPYRERYRRVVLLGPAHTVPFFGLAESSAGRFRTPLGDVEVDREALAGLDVPEMRMHEAAHRAEHSLEVQLPFLQRVLGSFSLVPIVVGEANEKIVARLIDMLWGGPETLFVVSTDLSHYLDYEQARQRDRETCRAIEGLIGERIGSAEACGANPLRGLLLAARRRGLTIETLDLRNSGDTAGDKRQVVGYGAWSVAEAES